MNMGGRRDGWGGWSFGEKRELGLVKRVSRRGLLGDGRAERRGDVCVGVVISRPKL